MVAVAYIRRSATGEAQASEDLQRETVERLAAERGDTIERVFKDWGKSGGSERRPAYTEMLRQAEADGIHAIYAYDQDRLARNIWMFSGLLRLADLKDFAIVTTAGDLTDDDRRDFAGMRGVRDGGELRKIKKRNKAVSAMQDKRGDDRGAAPFGYEARTPRKHGTERVEFVKVNPEGIDHVIEAYKAAGTFLGASKRLNAEGFKSKRDSEWHPVVVADLIRREAPELVAGMTQGKRSRTTTPRLLRGLLRCHCGGLMTPNSAGKGGLRYYCGRGQRGGHEPPYTIVERKLLPWVREEADRVIDPADEVTVDTEAPETDDSRERAALELVRGTIGEPAYLDAIAKLDAAAEARGQRARIVHDVPPPVDWKRWSTEDINAVLRARFEKVQLGADLLPVSAEWRYPEWRRS